MIYKLICESFVLDYVGIGHDNTEKEIIAVFKEDNLENELKKLIED